MEADLFTFNVTSAYYFLLTDMSTIIHDASRIGHDRSRIACLYPRLATGAEPYQTTELFPIITHETLAPLSSS